MTVLLKEVILFGLASILVFIIGFPLIGLAFKYGIKYINYITNLIENL